MGRLDRDEVGIFVRCEAGAEADWVGEPHVVEVRSSAAGVAGRLILRELLSFAVAWWRPDVMYIRQSTVSPDRRLRPGLPDASSTSTT